MKTNMKTSKAVAVRSISFGSVTVGNNMKTQEKLELLRKLWNTEDPLTYYDIETVEPDGLGGVRRTVTHPMMDEMTMVRLRFKNIKEKTGHESYFAHNDKYVKAYMRCLTCDKCSVCGEEIKSREHAYVFGNWSWIHRRCMG